MMAHIRGNRIEVNSQTIINTDDIAGTRIDSRDVNENASTSCSVVIESYPLVRNRRIRVTKYIQFPSYLDAGEFHDQLRKVIQKKLPPHLLKSKPNNRVLVLINPFSGQKKALKLWQDHGRAVLKAAGIDVEAIETEYPQHAINIIKNLNIDYYDAVLVNSGDGLVTEVLCGLLLRKDRERSLKIPICHIPGGTSNALAASICFACNEPFSPRNIFITECALMVTRPRYLPLRLYNVFTETDGLKSMFMSANWGLIADIDIGSERFRWAGMTRLHMEAILRIIQLPSVAHYRGRISYIPVLNKEISRKTMLKYNCSREHFGSQHFEYDDVNQLQINDKIETELFSSLDESLEGTSLIEMPALTEPLGENWISIEGDWVMVNVSTLSHLGSDLPYLPSARFDEPIMYLTLIDWNTIKTRFHIAHLFIFMEGSAHLSHPCMQIIPVYAVRVEPLIKTGYFAIDGEPCNPGSTFQVVPSKYCATVVGRKYREH